MKARIPSNYGGGMNNMAKRIQQMQEQVAKKTEEINETSFKSSVGGGAVKATVNGKKEVLSLDIQPEVVDPDDLEMLQDLIISAINQASIQAEKTMEEEMGKITGGMSIPGMF